MKLYTSPISPFGARVSIAAKVKGIEIEHIRPVGGLRTPEFLALNPIAKIPVLILDSGAVLPESQTILNYLEDLKPTPSMRPKNPEERARMNSAIQIMDTYVMASVIRTFPHLNPANRDQRVIDDEVMRWKNGLAALVHFMKLPMPTAEAGITIGDVCLATGLHLSSHIGRTLKLPEDPMQAHGVLVDYYAKINQHPILGPTLDALTKAQANH